LPANRTPPRAASQGKDNSEGKANKDKLGKAKNKRVKLDKGNKVKPEKANKDKVGMEQPDKLKGSQDSRNLDNLSPVSRSPVSRNPDNSPANKPAGLTSCASSMKLARNPWHPSRKS
jgi:hypothetical protein